MKLLTKLSNRQFYRRIIASLLAYVLFLNTFVSVTTAGPEGAQVVNGQVSIQQSGSNTAITASDKAIINYSSFDIARPETVQFIQPGSNASVLNRILSANPTNINGTLLANGRVFFVNPAGVYIGEGARINVNQFVASALNVSNSDFINGNYNFAGGNGAVINDGDISAERVYLIGKQVTNSGNISCPAGYVVMAAGDRVFLGEPGSDIVLDVEGTPLSESADAAASETGVLNEGTVDAAGGIIALAAAGDIYSQAISNVGSLSTSVDVGDAGQIKLAAADGTVINSGSIKAVSSAGTGGTVQMLGDKVGLFDAGQIDVSGSDGGGAVLVGGDYQGRGDVLTASRTYVGPDSSIKADATENGDGGKVIVWSDEITRFYGNISARGGAKGGNGGFVEVSGKENLGFYGYVDTLAPQGNIGTLLLDPLDIEVVAGGGLGLTDVDAFADVGSDPAVSQIDPATINAAGANVNLQAKNTITVTDSINMSNDSVGIIARAGDYIKVDASITTRGGTLDFTANDSGGTQSGSGYIDLNAALDTTGGGLTGGAVTLTVDGGTGDIELGDILTAGGGVTLGAPGGNIRIADSTDAVEVSAGGIVTIAANATLKTGGASTENLDVSDATALVIEDKGAGDIQVREQGSSTITSTTITVDNASCDNIDITYQDGDEVHINNGHEIDTTTLGHDFSYTGVAGSITDKGTVTLTGATASFTTDNPDDTITLDHQASTAAISLTTKGTAGHVTLDNGTTDLNLGKSSIAGNLVVTNGGTITQSGALTVTGTTSFTTDVDDKAITLDDTGNALAGVVRLDTLGTGNATIVNTTGVDLGTSNVGGNLDVTVVTGNITDSGTITVGGAASFTTSNVNDDIDLDTLAVTGAIDLNTNGYYGNATIVNTTAIELGTSNVGGDLEVTATTGDITDSGTVTVGAWGIFTTINPDDDIYLDTLEVAGLFDLSTNGSTGNATIVNATGIDLLTSTISGDLDLTATTGNITDSGNVIVVGAASFTTSTANDDIDLGTLAVDGAIDLNTSGATGNATIVNATGINLGTSNVGGNLDVTATNGTITDAGTLTITGASSFTANGAGGSILLDTLAADGTVALDTGGNATVTNNTSLRLAASNIGGTLDAVATNGAISDTGTVAVAGAASFTANGTGSGITLDTLAANSTLTLDTTGNAEVTNDTSLQLAGLSNIGGTFEATATNGTITDTDTLTITGASSFTANGAGGGITLDTLAADGTVALDTGGNATVTNNTSLRLAASNIGGTLDAVATNGAISDTGTVAVAGAASFTANGTGSGITLDTLAANSTLTLDTTGNAEVTNDTSLQLAASSVGGTFDATATNGTITDAGTLTITGASSFTANGAGGGIALDTLAADGTVTLDTVGNAIVTNDTSLRLAASNIGGTLDAVATNAAISDMGTVAVAGAASFVANGLGGGITLDTLAADGTVAMDTVGSIAVTNDATLKLGTSEAGGTLDITAKTGNIDIGGSITSVGGMEFEAVTGAITQNAGIITSNVGSVIMKSAADLNMTNYNIANPGSTNLTLDSTSGSVTSDDADDWKSITATAKNNIELQGTGDIKIGGDLESTSGGVSIVSDSGTVLTTVDNVTITGNSTSGTGVDLPFGSGKAAIMIITKEDLTLGSNIHLKAKGQYDPQQNDDRLDVGFDPSLSGGGDPIDVAIYLGSHRKDAEGEPIGHVAVESMVEIAKDGTMVVDAGEKVTFGGKFNESVFNQTHRLEVVSRRSTTLNEVVTYKRLPYADEPESIRNWFTSPGSFTGAYALRGKEFFAEILALINPVPLVAPRPLELEVRNEVEGQDTDALEKLLNELGIGVQPYVTDAYAASLSTDLRLYSAAEKLQQLIPVLEDVGGTRIAGLRTAVAQTFPSLDVLSEERMDSFAQELTRHKGDGSDYDLAGQCIFALTEYVNILGTDIGWPVEKSVGFVMGRYVPRLTEGDEIRIAVIQMQLQKALGIGV